MTELQPVIVPGVPGIRYEATWGRKTAKSKTFIGRVYERVEGGGVQLWACDHKHPDEAQALDCATAEAKAIAARALADYRPPDVQALRDAVATAFPGMTITFADPRVERHPKRPFETAADPGSGWGNQKESSYDRPDRHAGKPGRRLRISRPAR